VLVARFDRGSGSQKKTNKSERWITTNTSSEHSLSKWVNNAKSAEERYSATSRAPGSKKSVEGTLERPHNQRDMRGDDRRSVQSTNATTKENLSVTPAR
jgi:hypothetical protein